MARKGGTRSAGTLAINLDLEFSKLAKKLNQVEGTMKTSLGRMSKQFNTLFTFGGATAALAGVTYGVKELGSAVIDMVRRGQALSELGTAFDNLYGKTIALSGDGIGKLREAIGGLVSDVDMFQAANLAAQAGLSPENFLEIAKSAEALGDAVGKDATTALADLSKGIALSQEKLLRQYGIVVDTTAAHKEFAKSIGTTADKLSDAGKKEAELVASMQALREKTKTVSSDVRLAGDELDRMGASISNLLGKMGQFINSSESVSGTFAAIADSANYLTKVVENLNKALSSNALFSDAFGKGAMPTTKEGLQARLDLKQYDINTMQASIKDNPLIASIMGWDTKLQTLKADYLETLKAIDALVTGKTTELPAKKSDEATSFIDKDKVSKDLQAISKERDRIFEDWAKTSGDTLQTTVDQSINDAIKNQDAAAFESLATKLSDSLGKEFDDNWTKKFASIGTQLPNNYAEQRQAHINNVIEPLGKKYKETAEEVAKNTEKALKDSFTEAADFWESAMQNVFTGETFDWKQTADEFGMSMAAGFLGALGPTGAKNIKDLGRQMGDGVMSVIDKVFGVYTGNTITGPNGELVKELTSLGKALQYIPALAQVTQQALDFERQNREANNYSGTGGLVGSGVGAAVGSIGGPEGAMVGTQIGSMLGSMIGSIFKPGNNADTAVRHAFAGYIEEQMQRLSTAAFYGPSGQMQLINAGRFNFWERLVGGAPSGNTQNRNAIQGGAVGVVANALIPGSSLAASVIGGGALGGVFGGGRRQSGFNDPNWINRLTQYGARATNIFTGLAQAIASASGQTTTLGDQLATLLAQNMLGNLDNARLLVQQLGMSFEELSQALLDAALKGSMRWSEYINEVAGLRDAFEPGLIAVGDFVGAFNELVNSGGRGIAALKGFRDIAIEAMEAGVTTFEGLRQRLTEQGLPQEQISALFDAVSQSGITSLQDWANASDQQAGTIVGSMENLSASLQQQWQTMMTNIDQLNNRLAMIPSDIPVSINISVNDPSNAIDTLINADSSSANVQTNARGGIFDSPKFFSAGGQLNVLGEAGPEAVLPLKRINGKLGVISTGSGGGMVFNIDARGATPGMENRILAAMSQIEKRAVSKAVQAVAENNRRGGY